MGRARALQPEREPRAALVGVGAVVLAAAAVGAVGLVLAVLMAVLVR